MLHCYFLWNQKYREELFSKSGDLDAQWGLVMAQYVEYLGVLEWLRSLETFELQVTDMEL